MNSPYSPLHTSLQRRVSTNNKLIQQFDQLPQLVATNSEVMMKFTQIYGSCFMFPSVND